MPQRDAIHQFVREALIKDGWQITDDPYIISYGERFLFVDLGAVNGKKESHFIGVQRQNQKIAVEIKAFRGKSAIKDLEQAIGQYVLYDLLLKQVDTDREIYLAVTDVDYLVIDVETTEVKLWIQTDTEKQ